MNELYIDLLKRTILNTIYADGSIEYVNRAQGRNIQGGVHSMIGWKRMNNLQKCCERVIKKKIPGDFIETGVWHGGACMLMKAILNVYNEDRKVWLADSFEGIPKPSIPQDDGHDLYQEKYFCVSQEKVIDNFERYDNLLDDNVKFLKGWFKDTLPTAPIDQLAILRLDGDLYESTMDAFTHLYPKLSIGGYVIVDDYGCYRQCQEAVNDYREAHNIKEPIVEIDYSGVYWRKTC